MSAYLKRSKVPKRLPARTLHSPIYTLGSADVRSFSRNKRGIAGTLIWVNFDRHAFLSLVNKLGGTFIANSDDVRPQFQTNQNAFISQNAIFQGGLVRDNPSASAANATINQLSGQQLSG
jgi:hypothetical protein